MRTLVLAALLALAACSSATSPSDVATPSDSASSDTRSETGLDVVDTGGSEIGTDAPDASDVPGELDVNDVVVSDASFNCGGMRCDPATEYCQVVIGGPVGDSGPTATYRCDPWAIACPTDHSCACLMRNLKCATTCMEDASGDVTTVCGLL